MSAWLSIAITIVLIVVAFVVLNRNINVRTSQQAALDEIKREVGAIITELNSTTERNVELIEDRISNLERLIEQADRRVGALRRDLASRQGESVTYSHLRRPVDRSGAASAEPSSPPEIGPTSPSSRENRREPGRSAGEPDTRPDDEEIELRFARERAHLRSEGPARGDEPTVPPRERVRRLYLQGVPLERIAAIVGKTVGEVELIVSLDWGTGEQ